MIGKWVLLDDDSIEDEVHLAAFKVIDVVGEYLVVEWDAGLDKLVGLAEIEGGFFIADEDTAITAAAIENGDEGVSAEVAA